MVHTPSDNLSRFSHRAVITNMNDVSLKLQVNATG